MPRVSHAFALAIARRRQARGRRGLRRKPPRQRYPFAAELAYAGILHRLVGEMAARIRTSLVEQLPAIARERDLARPVRGDDWVDTFDAILASLRIALGTMTQGAEETAHGIGVDVSNFNREEFRRVVRAVLGVDPIASEPWLAGQLKAFAKENATLIKSIPERLLSDVEGVALRGLQSGTRPEVIARDVQERFGVTERRARIIARDQVGKLNGQMSELRQTELGVAEYIWRGALDERERPEHVAREGKRFKWSDPPSDGHPGEPILCRCYPEPVLDGLIDGAAA